MKLLFDLEVTQPNGSGKRHGGGKYGEVVLRRMIAQGAQFDCVYNSALWFNPDMEQLVRGAGLGLIDRKGRSLQQIVDEGGYKRIYACLVYKEHLGLRGCQLLATVHGLRGLETPPDKCFWRYKNTLREQVKMVLKRVVPRLWHRRQLGKEGGRLLSLVAQGMARVVVVSEHTKYAIRSFYPELQLQLFDIPCFYSPNFYTRPAKPIDTGERYFLCVSGNRWEKNNLRAIEAFDRLLSAGLMPSNVRMKVTGAASASVYRYKLRNPQSFDFLGYVADEELERLYAGAYCFVYPSLNEGFGYPPLEAMRYGVPVLASPLSSIAEVLDGAAIYFNPFLVEEIMGRMQMVMEPSVRKEFSARALAQAGKIEARQEQDLEAMARWVMKN